MAFSALQVAFTNGGVVLLGQANEKPPQNSQDEWEEDELEVLKYGAKLVTLLLIPVSICMVGVVATVSSTNYFQDVELPYTPFTEKTDDTATIIWHAIGNALIIIGGIACMTTILILLYVYRFYKTITALLIFSSLLILCLFSYMYISEFLMRFNIPMDFMTFVFIMWNYGVVGIICIHWKGPLLLQQAYLILLSALMALVFLKHLPHWTTWVLLGVLSVWDVIAVLCPKGPLRILVETAQEREEQLFPSLIYSSTMAWYIIMSDIGGSFSRSEQERDERSSSRRRKTKRRHRHRHRKKVNDDLEDEEETGGIKLGLGDFIFYSVMVGEATSYGDWNTTLACFVGILIGLCLTLLLLAIYRKALPALPISITFGVFFYFTTRLIVEPFTDILASEHVYI